MVATSQFTKEAGAIKEAGGSSHAIDAALVRSVLRAAIASEERRAAEAAMQSAKLEAHKHFLREILSNEDLRLLLIATNQSISVCPAMQDDEGNMKFVYLKVQYPDDVEPRATPEKIARGKLALIVGQSWRCITVESLFGNGSDEFVESLFRVNAFVDPIKAEQPSKHGYWLRGERTLSPGELGNIIDNEVRELGKRLSVAA